MAEKDLEKAAETTEHQAPGGLKIEHVGKAAVGEVEKLFGFMMPGGKAMENVKVEDVAMAAKGQEYDVPKSLVWKGSGTSDEFNQQVLGDVRALPPGLLRVLDKQGYHFVTVHHPSDAEPELKKMQPRDWPQGTTYDATDGFYKAGGSKKIILAEDHWDPQSKQWAHNDRVGGVLRHEMSHALNEILGKDFPLTPEEIKIKQESGEDDGRRTHDLYSDTQEFRDAWNKDRFNSYKLSPEEQARIEYYIQRGHGSGRDEAFADISALLLGGPCNKEDREVLEKCFPETIKLVKKRMHDLGLDR